MLALKVSQAYEHEHPKEDYGEDVHDVLDVSLATGPDSNRHTQNIVGELRSSNRLSYRWHSARLSRLSSDCMLWARQRNPWPCMLGQHLDQYRVLQTFVLAKRGGTGKPPEPRDGFEPPATCLQCRSSSTELPWQKAPVFPGCHA